MIGMVKLPCLFGMEIGPGGRGMEEELQENFSKNQF